MFHWNIPDIAFLDKNTQKQGISLIKNDCKMEKKYKDRVDKFFAFSDDKNCERVYNEIKKLMNID